MTNLENIANKSAEQCEKGEKLETALHKLETAETHAAMDLRLAMAECRWRLDDLLVAIRKG